MWEQEWKSEGEELLEQEGSRMGSSCGGRVAAAPTTPPLRLYPLPELKIAAWPSDKSKIGQIRHFLGINEQ